MEVHTDFPERLVPQTEVFIGDDHMPMILDGVRTHGSGLLIKLRGLDTPEAVAPYRNQLVFVPAKNRPPLPKGKFYYHELIGFQVLGENDEAIGVLSDILRTGANDVYVVTRPDGGELLLPVIASVVLAIDGERRCIRVRLLDGL